MLHQLLVVLAAGSVAFGVLDVVRSLSEMRTLPTRSEESPTPSQERRLVRIQADDAPAAMMAVKGAPGLPPGANVVLLALNRPRPGRHVVVRIVPADEHGRPLSAAPWVGGVVTGLLSPLPAGLVPLEGQARFPEGCTISWIEREYVPGLGYPLALLACGALGLVLLLVLLGAHPPAEAAGDPERAPPDERTPLMTVHPATAKAAVLATVCIAALGAVIAVRHERIGPARVFENPLVALAGCAVAFLAGFALERRTGSGAVLCLGGIQRSADPDDPTGFVRWDAVRTVTRESGGGCTLVLGTASGEALRLELGSGPEAERAAAAVATLVRPGILPGLRDLLVAGKELDFGPVRLSNDAIGWELVSGWRMTEFDDLRTIRVGDGVFGVTSLTSDYEDVTFRYQEVPNGFLLPLLLVTGKKSARSACRLTFKADGGADPFLGHGLSVAGADAWIARVEPLLAETLVRHGQFHLAEAEAACARGEGEAALARTSRALACFESAGKSEPAAVRAALLALGHAMLEARQPSLAKVAFERAVKLAESARAVSPVELGRAFHGLALARWQCKDTEGALANATRATELFDGQPDAPIVHHAMALNTLAGLYHSEGQPIEAQEVMDALLTRLERATPEELAESGSARLLAYMQNTSMVCAQLQDPKLLVTAHGRGVELCRRLAGADALLVGQGLYSLGSSQLAGHEAGAACATLEEALTIFETNLGEQHPWMAGCLDRLGEAYWYSGGHDQAMRAWEMAAAIVEGGRAPGPSQVAG